MAAACRSAALPPAACAQCQLHAPDWLKIPHPASSSSSSPGRYAAEVRLSGGSAVVRMRTPSQAGAAIAALNGVVPEGGWQQLTVRAAETAEQRSSRITAINGRQGGLGSPLQPPPALPPVGPGAALRRVHSARPASSQGSLQCFTGGVLGGEAPSRRSADWGALGSAASMDSSRRSSMDASALRGGRSSSDSGSDELPALAAEATALPTGELQRLLLEAVLALVGQVEAGQLSLVSLAWGHLGVMGLLGWVQGAGAVLTVCSA